MDFEKYKLKKTYPVRPSKPLLKQGANSQDFRDHADALDRYNVLKVEYDKICAGLQKEQSELHEQFRKDLYEEFGVTNNSKADIIWSRAYDRGHSGGFSEVYGEFAELVGFAREIDPNF